jgi:oligopeptide/dipeptide ABC transporter ATP-binding protein
MSDAPILEVRDLTIRIATRRGSADAVEGVSFDLHRGETLGLVGESGSGKSLTCLALLRLLPRPAASIAGGSLRFRGEELATKSDAEMARFRGRHLAMVLQDPMTALNPVLTVGHQLLESLRLHTDLGPERRRDRACRLLARLRIPDPAARLGAWPHQFSGGMRQRLVGAIALAGEPEILVADEPTTALDVTVQAAYLDLLKSIQRERGLAVIFVTHDFAVVARMCDRVAVMYAGRIVELAPVADLFDRPAHPYSAALLRSVPDVDADVERLPAIAGQPPDILARPQGCAFAPRCPDARDICRAQAPPEVHLGPGRMARCWNHVA